MGTRLTQKDVDSMTADKPLRLSDAPLVHVLAQLLFNPVSEIANYIQKIEIALRAKGFLDANETKVQNLNLDLDTQKVTVNPSSSWIFIHKEQTRSILVGAGAFVFQASAYDHFAPFSKELLACLQEVQKVVPDIQQVRRLGLRYVNLITLSEQETAEKWVRKELLGGPLPEKAGTYHFSRIERHLTLPSGNLVIRYCDQPKQPPLPPGINPWGLLVPVKVLQRGERFIILDLDGFRTDRFDFNVKDIEATFQSFNHALQAAFESCTTEDAMKKWGAEK